MSDNSEPSEKLNLNISGAVLRTIHVERTEMIYPMFETELRTISLFNNLMAFCASIGTGLLTFAGGLFVQALQQDNATDNAWDVVEIVCPILVVVGVIAYMFAAWAFFARGSELEGIKKNAKQPAA